jgi:hypothetical protein
MFNLAIDSKLRGCDVVAVKVDDVAAAGHTADRWTPASGGKFHRSSQLRAARAEARSDAAIIGGPFPSRPANASRALELRVPADRDHRFQVIVITHSRAS